MPKFGKESLKQLATCHPDLQWVLEEAIKHIDFSVVCGFRGQADQHKAFIAGTSTLDWPKGRHNKKPSLAADVVPYPSGYKSSKNQIYLAGFIIGIGATMGVKLRWGGDWDSDRDTQDELGLIDFPHIEVIL